MTEQLLDKILEIARKRREILEQMRRAIEAGDKESVLWHAKKLTGLNDEECRRINSRLN